MTKTLVVGFDGLEHTLVDKWINELPNFKKIMSKGVTGIIRSPGITVTPAIWTSMFSGVNAGKHGVYDFRMNIKDPDKTEIAQSNHVSKPRVWEIISDERSIVFNVPLTHPVRPINGIMVSDFLTPDNSNTWAYPADMQYKLNGLVDGYEFIHKVFYDGSNEDELSQGIYDVTKKQVRTILHLMKTQEWDITFANFMMLDWIQHSLWKFHDKNHPQHKSKKQNPVKEAYKKADKILGKLVSEAGKNPNIIICSDHGFGPYKKELLLNKYLIEKGYLSIKKDSLLSRIYLKFKVPRFVIKLIQKLGLGRIAIDTYISVFKNVRKSHALIDYDKSKAFAGGNTGQIFIFDNSIKKELIDDLNSLAKDLNVKLELTEKEECFKGKFVDTAPDLMLTINNHEILVNPSLRNDMVKGKSLLRDPISFTSGDHRPDGFLCLSGPKIKKSKKKLHGKMEDIAATVIDLRGKKIPKYFDGKSMLS